MQRFNTSKRDQQATAAIENFLLGDGQYETSAEALELSKTLFGFQFNECDANGNTLLMYILLLIRECVKNETNPIKKNTIPHQAEKLIELLFNLTVHYPLAHLVLLTTQNHAGKNPLNEALDQEESVMATTIIREARLTHQEGKILPADYAKFLSHSDAIGFSPLESALGANNVTGLNAYAAELARVYRNGALAQAKYRALLIQPNTRGYTPLHVALKYASSKTLSAYLSIIKDCSCVSREEYKKLLLSRIGKENLLHLVMSQGESKKIEIYLAEIKALFFAGVLAAEEIRALFLGADNNDCSPFVMAYSSVNPENFHCFIRELMDLHKNKIITQDEYKQEFMKVNNDGFNPLMQILKHGTVEIFEIYTQHVGRLYYTNIISAAEYNALIMHAAKYQFNAMHQAIYSIYLERFIGYVKSALANNIISRADYKNLLLKFNGYGFNPFLGILKSANPNHVKIYLSEIKNACEDKILSPEELKALMTSCNYDKLTTLHHATRTGSVETVKNFIEFIEANFSEKESADIIARLLTSEDSRGFVPSCHNKNPGANEVYRYLNVLREKHKEAIREIEIAQFRSKQIRERDEVRTPLSANTVWRERVSAAREVDRHTQGEDRRDRSPVRKDRGSDASAASREDDRSYRRR